MEGIKSDGTYNESETKIIGGADLTKIEELFLIFKDVGSDLNVVFGTAWLFLFLSTLVNFLSFLGGCLSGEYSFSDGVYNLIIVVSN